MPDHFYSPRLTLERAKYHFRDFEARIAAFADGKQGAYFVERDGERGNNRHKIKFEKTFFEEVPSIVFDCINNMKAAIDQSVYAACIASGRPASDLEFVHLPVTKTAKFFADRLKGIANIPDEIKSLMTAFEPYQGGNDTVFQLNRLCNARKHAILMPITTDPHGLEIRTGPVTLFLRHRWIPENYEIEILDAGRADFSYAHSIAFRIAFDDPEPWVGGSEPLAVLTAFSHEAQSFLMTMEGESRRLWPRAFD